ncbi:hypothetical protein G6F31_018617 [Rhizopus arrhizus]|nr:hypothetical protein G6F31_018617 [Rhizopus arrhizus]
MAGRGPQQPLPPGLGFFPIAGVQQRIQGQGGIAQPAMPVIPVAATAQLLGQRRRGRRDDAAGRLKGQQLQGDQRSHDSVSPFAQAIFPMTALGPFAPPRNGAIHALQAVRHEMRRLVRTVIRQGEGHGLILPHGEFGHALHIAAGERHGRMQLDGVRPGNGAQPVIAPAHPGHGLPVS